MGLGEAEMGGAGEIAGAAAEDALLFAMEEMGSFIPMGMQYQPTVESAEDVLKKQAELQFYEVGGGHFGHVQLQNGMDLEEGLPNGMGTRVLVPGAECDHTVAVL